MSISLVGAGPGEPEHLTLRAEALLAAARTVVTDAAVSHLAAAFAPRATIVVADGRAAELLVVGPGPAVRLYRGDPWLHEAHAAEAAALRAAGRAFDEIPGVSVAVGRATAAGVPTHHRHRCVVATIGGEALDA